MNADQPQFRHQGFETSKEVPNTLYSRGFDIELQGNREKDPKFKIRGPRIWSVYKTKV